MQTPMLTVAIEPDVSTTQAPVRRAALTVPRQPMPITQSSPGANSDQHVPVLDAWRGTAVVLLMVGHFLPNARIDCGALGVEFFFVLSGFLMGRILFLKRTPLSVFYQRRISRIFPAAYFFLTVVLGWSWIASGGSEPDLSLSAACLLFYFNYYIALGAPSSSIPVGHFWSLCVEEHAYILLSGLSLIHRKNALRARVLIGAAVGACLTMAIVVGTQRNWDYYEVYWRSDCRAASILMGAFAACLVGRGYGSQQSYGRIPTIYWGIAAVMVGVMLQLWFVPEFIKYSAGTMCLTTGLLFISQHGRGKVWANPLLTWLGTISFSLYLWQQPFFLAVKSGQMTPVPAIVASIVAAVLSYTLIEKPARSYFNRRSAKSSRLTTGVSAGNS